jgi:hypothetical protein
MRTVLALVAAAVASAPALGAQLPPDVVGYPPGYFMTVVDAWDFVGCFDGAVYDDFVERVTIMGRVTCMRGRVTYGMTWTRRQGWGGWLDLAYTDADPRLRVAPRVSVLDTELTWSWLPGAEGRCLSGAEVCTHREPPRMVYAPTADRPWFAMEVAEFPWEIELGLMDPGSLQLTGLAIGLTYAPGGANSMLSDWRVPVTLTSATTVPEPTTYALTAAGLVVVYGVARRRRHSTA